MKHPLISIIIPVYNGSDYLGCAIDSALAQSYKNFEVIVVNDGSNDDGASRKAALAYGDKIRYIEKENGGVATAFNRALDEMKGEYFSWLSHDDYYLPDKLMHQVALLDRLDKTTILYGDYVQRFTDSGKEIPVRFEGRFTERQLCTPLFPIFKGLANACTMLIHKSHFDRVGLFNPSLKSTQDYDMWFRMFRGAQVAHGGYADVVMRQHPNQGHRTMTSHTAEEEKLWIRLCEELKEYEMAEIDGTPYDFYHAMYTRFKPANKRIAEYYAQRMQCEQEFRRSDKTSDADRLVDALIDHLDVLKRECRDYKEKLDAYRRDMPIWQKIRYSLKNDGIKNTLYKCYFYGIKKG